MIQGVGMIILKYKKRMMKKVTFTKEDIELRYTSYDKIESSLNDIYDQLKSIKKDLKEQKNESKATRDKPYTIQF